MAVLPILEYPDPLLRRKAVAVQHFNAELQQLVSDLIETLNTHGGIGLAAPQTGDLRQVLVMDHSADKTAPEVYINPEILSQDVLALVEESCLSVPKVVANVVRAIKLRVRAFDVHGEPFERELENMHAVCLQHELDHLDGKLFIDRLSLFRRLRIRAAAGKAARQAMAEAG